MLNRQIKNLVAKRHIAGPDFENAEEICNWSHANGWSATISIWTHPEEDKNSVAEKYIKIINTISQKGLDCYLSIKPSSLEFDPRLFEYITLKIPDNKVRIHFDSLSPDLAERSLQYFKEAKTMYDNVGYTIPARWLRSFNDVNEIAGMKVPVRIVKGQWQDPDDIKIDVNDNFLKLVRLLCNKVPLVAIATHDHKLAQKAISILENSETKFEIEQFFSLPIINKKINHQGLNKVKLRLYIAFGQPYLPYNLRNFVERPAVLGWFLRDILNLKQPFDFIQTIMAEMNI